MISAGCLIRSKKLEHKVSSWADTSCIYWGNPFHKNGKSFLMHTFYRKPTLFLLPVFRVSINMLLLFKCETYSYSYTNYKPGVTFDYQMNKIVLVLRGKQKGLLKSKPYFVFIGFTVLLKTNQNWYAESVILFTRILVKYTNR